MFNKEHFTRFLNFAFRPEDGGCYELTCWKSRINNLNRIEKAQYGVVVGGWFNKAMSLEAAGRRVGDTCAYIGINPVHPDRLAQIGNTVGQVGKGEGTKNEDI